MKILRNLLLFVVAMASVGCVDEFDPFNQVRGFRVLALTADPPALLPTEAATLGAFLTDDDATYEWSWCPITLGAADSFNCLFTRQQLQDAVDDFLGPGVVVIPDFDLGTDATATFAYDFAPELLRGLCEAILGGMGGDIPELDELPSCETQFEIKVRLVARSRGQEVVAVRDVDLLLSDDGDPPNQNPVFGGASFRVADSGADLVPMPVDTPTQLSRGVEYEVVLDVPETSAESYLEVPDGETEPVSTLEDLTATWFFEVGDLDRARTSFLEASEGNNDFENLRRNLYTPPLVEDSAETNVKLYFVLRDNRGGTAFDERRIELVP